MFNVKEALFVWSENGPKLQIRESFAAASKMKRLVILRISEVSSKLWLKLVRMSFLV